MKNFVNHIGGDISKETIDFTVLKEGQYLFHFRIPNNKQGFKLFEKKLKQHRISGENTLICLENTGLYGESFARWMFSRSYNIWIEHANEIKNSQGVVRGKSDKKDSSLIAMYAFRFQDKHTLWQPKRKSIRMLQMLTATRDRLINAKNQLNVPLQESADILDKAEQKSIEASNQHALKGLKKSLKIVEEKIDHIIKKDKKTTKMMKVLTSIDGVGTQIAIGMIVYTDEFQKVNSGKQLSCYVGVVPFEHSSGTSVRGRNRVSHQANKKLKKLLHMGVLSAIQCSEELGAYYERKVKEGKPKLSVINAIKNKMILRIFACIRDDRMYEKKYVRKIA